MHISGYCRSNISGNSNNQNDKFGYRRRNFGRGNFVNQHENYNQSTYRGSNRVHGNSNRNYAGNTEVDNLSLDVDSFHICINSYDSKPKA